MTKQPVNAIKTTEIERANLPSRDAMRRSGEQTTIVRGSENLGESKQSTTR